MYMISINKITFYILSNEPLLYSGAPSFVPNWYYVLQSTWNSSQQNYALTLW